MSTRSNAEHDTAVSAAGSADTGESALQPGTTVHEFRVLKLVGEGGFGIVYLAHDESLDRTVALKEYMPAELAERAGGTTSVRVRSARYAETFDAGMRSFINEAKLLARFDHPSLLKVYRFFQDNGTAYMAMPFYEGQTLKAVLRGLSGPPDEKWLRRVLYQLLDGLQVIHGYDCFHRDIAPDNILMVQSDVPVLLDFGAARRVIADATQQLTVILKPGYAPIEQYAEDPHMKQGAWTDIYALASVVHFAMTGKAPPAAVARAMSDSLVPLSQRMRGVLSDGLLKTIDAALSVEPKDRPQSVASLRTMLLASDGDTAVSYAPAASVLAIEPLAPAAEATTGRDAPMPARVPVPVVTAADDSRVAPVKSRQPYAPAGSNRAGIAGLVLAVVAAVGALWWLVTRNDEPPPRQAQAPAASTAESVPAATEPARVPPARVEQAAPSPPGVALAPPVQAPVQVVTAPPKSQAPPPVRADAAKAKAPDAPKAAVVAEAKPSAAPKAAVGADPKPPAAPPTRTEVRTAPQPAPRAEDPVEAPQAARAPPQQVARVEPKAEPAPTPPAKAEPSRPVEVARVEPKATAPALQPSALLGRYTGRLMDAGSPVAITLVISSVDAGVVSGPANQGVGRCEGDYRMTGTFRDDALRMRSTHSGGRYGDCSLGFRATVQGAKLVGQTTGGAPLELSR